MRMLFESQRTWWLMALALLSACGQDCERQESEPFSVSYDVSAEEVQDAADLWTDGVVEELPCDDLCEFVVDRDASGRDPYARTCSATPLEDGAVHLDCEGDYAFTCE
jgi:hypothetical protein